MSNAKRYPNIDNVIVDAERLVFYLKGIKKHGRVGYPMPDGSVVGPILEGDVALGRASSLASGLSAQVARLRMPV